MNLKTKPIPKTIFEYIDLADWHNIDRKDFNTARKVVSRYFDSVDDAKLFKNMVFETPEDISNKKLTNPKNINELGADLLKTLEHQLWVWDFQFREADKERMTASYCAVPYGFILLCIILEHIWKGYSITFSDVTITYLIILGGISFAYFYYQQQLKNALNKLYDIKYYLNASGFDLYVGKNSGPECRFFVKPTDDYPYFYKITFERSVASYKKIRKRLEVLEYEIRDRERKFKALKKE